jgi:hypothetical protein
MCIARSGASCYVLPLLASIGSNRNRFRVGATQCIGYCRVRSPRTHVIATSRSGDDAHRNVYMSLRHLKCSTKAHRPPNLLMNASNPDFISESITSKSVRSKNGSSCGTTCRKLFHFCILIRLHGLYNRCSTANRHLPRSRRMACHTLVCTAASFDIG